MGKRIIIFLFIIINELKSMALFSFIKIMTKYLFLN